MAGPSSSPQTHDATPDAEPPICTLVLVGRPTVHEKPNERSVFYRPSSRNESA
jgi:hypothetical protein